MVKPWHYRYIFDLFFIGSLSDLLFKNVMCVNYYVHAILMICYKMVCDSQKTHVTLDMEKENLHCKGGNKIIILGKECSYQGNSEQISHA